jgi:hypothetical protein
MSDLHGFPYIEFQVDKAGTVIDPAERARAVDLFGQGAVTDLLVLSHGWNNDMAEARTLYDHLLAALRACLVAGTPPLGARRLGVLAVLWPSKKFAEKSLIPGQAASIDSGEMADALMEHIDTLKGGFDDPEADAKLAAARELSPKLADSPAAQREFVRLVRGLLTRKPADDEGSTDDYFTLDGRDLLQRLAGPVQLPPTPAASSDGGGAQNLGDAPASDVAGGAASIGGFFSGIASAASNLLNLTTYYQMKERAGMIGRGTVHALVREIADGPKPPKIHLAGHSFGARLVTSVALGADDQAPLSIGSMTLLQAAFSHNAFSDGSTEHPVGFFRSVVAAPGRLSGPLLVTHTSRDLPVGLAYPLASRIAGQNTAGLGDANDPYGGLGRNGAQGTPEASELDFGKPGTHYVFKGGRVYNMNGDTLILGHSDIMHPETAYALLAAVAAC